MLKARILKVRTTFFSKDESSGLLHFTIACKEKPGEAELADLGLFDYHCYCAHDCCGHLQTDTPQVVLRLKRREWYVTQHWYYNI